jgi:putative transposase
VAFDDHKEFAQELYPIYQAVTREVAETQLLKLEERWNKKYPQVRSWFNNWSQLGVRFDFPQQIRRLL